MKKAILLIITVLLSFFSTTYAQTSDAQQRERDIRIAEGIITELFENQRTQGVFPRLSSKNVRGEYIPGFGVHFTIYSGLSGFVFQNLDSDEDEIRVEIQSDRSTDSEVNSEDEVKEKIYEYMTKYASLISGVPDDETIRVTYAPNRKSSTTWVFFNDGERTEYRQSGISVWATVSDLKMHRNGQISEQELLDRIKTYTMDKEETHTDFNIFASVLETALKDLDTNHLRVSGKPQMEYLPGLGVRYRVHVSARPSVILNEIKIFDDNFEFRMDSLRMNLDESLKLMEESLNPLILKLDSVMELDMTDEEREQIREELRRERSDIHERHESFRTSLRPVTAPRSATDSDSVDVRPEADAIIDELLNVIDNYGSTLTSLEDEEMLMISVNWSSRSDDLPERTEVRIKKSDLLRGEDPDIEEIERR